MTSVEIAVILFACYLIGSIPTAYIAVWRKAGLDIRRSGSGNVGAFNTFDVTKSKSIGIIVGILDAFKGFIVSGSLAWIFRTSFEVQAAGLILAVLGHNYPVWLNFKGGRGLSTGAGGLFAIGVSYTIVWCVVWAIVYGYRKDILLGNVIAILVSPVVLLLVPGSLIQDFAVATQSASAFRIFAFVLSGLLLLSHADAIHDLRTKRRVGNE